jgi:putative flippase GtrA
LVQLVECKGGTSRRATQKILNGLIINAVENGAVISACLVLNVALYTVYPGNLIHVSWLVTPAIPVVAISLMNFLLHIPS